MESILKNPKTSNTYPDTNSMRKEISKTIAQNCSHMKLAEEKFGENFPEEWMNTIIFSLKTIPEVIENLGDIYRESVLRKVNTHLGKNMARHRMLQEPKHYGKKTLLQKIIDNKTPIYKSPEAKSQAIEKFDPEKYGYAKSMHNVISSIRTNTPDATTKIAFFIVLLFAELKSRLAKIKLYKTVNQKLSNDILKNFNFPSNQPYDQDWYHLTSVLSGLTKDMNPENRNYFLEIIKNGIKGFRVKEAESEVIKMISRNKLSENPSLDNFGIALYYPYKEAESHMESLLQMLYSINPDSIIKVSNKRLLQLDQSESTIHTLTNLLKLGTSITKIISFIDYKIRKSSNTTILNIFLGLIQNKLKGIDNKYLTKIDKEKIEEIYNAFGVPFGNKKKKHNTTSNEEGFPFCNITIKNNGINLEIQVKALESSSFDAFIKTNPSILETREIAKENNYVKDYLSTIKELFQNKIEALEHKIQHIDHDLKEKYYYSNQQEKDKKQRRKQLYLKLQTYRAGINTMEYNNFKQRYESTKPEEQTLMKPYFDEAKTIHKKLSSDSFILLSIPKKQEEFFFSKLIKNISGLEHHIYKENNRFLQNFPLREGSYQNHIVKEQIKLQLDNIIHQLTKNIYKGIISLGRDDLKEENDSYVIPLLDMDKKQKYKYIMNEVIRMFINQNNYLKDAKINTNRDNKRKKLLSSLNTYLQQQIIK